MNPLINDAFFWWAGVLAVMTVFTLTTVLLLRLSYWSTSMLLRQLLSSFHLVMVKAALASIEKHGMLRGLDEYRKAVAERKPKDIAAFRRIQNDLEDKHG